MRTPLSLNLVGASSDFPHDRTPTAMERNPAAQAPGVQRTKLERTEHRLERRPVQESTIAPSDQAFLRSA